SKVLLPQPEGPRKTTNSPAWMSRSMSRSASWARLVPAAQILPRPRQVTASLDEKVGASEATQLLLGVGQPVENTPLGKPQQPVEGEAQHADHGDGEEHQRGIEGVARQHDDLAHTVADTGRFSDQHHHPG